MRLQSVEGWRGIACLLVVLFHASIAHSLMLEPWLRQLEPVLDFFFILSGFVMALGFSDKVTDGPSFWGFLLRRCGRIWPLHLVTLAMLILIVVVRFARDPGRDPFVSYFVAEALPYHLFLIQAWFPEFDLTWNYPAWTLSAEVFAYLLMALLVLVSLNTRMRLALATLAIAVSAFMFCGGPDAYSDLEMRSISRGVFGFFVGFVLYHFWRKYPLRNVKLANVLEFVSAFGFIAVIAWPPQGVAYVACHAVFMLLIYAFSHDLGVISKLLSVRPLVWLGRVSFSIYMFHIVVMSWLMAAAYSINTRVSEPILKAFHDPFENRAMTAIALPEQWQNDALTLGYILVTLAGAGLLFRFVEDPSRIYFAKLASKFTDGQRAKAALAASTATKPRAAGAPGGGGA